MVSPQDDCHAGYQTCKFKLAQKNIQNAAHHALQHRQPSTFCHDFDVSGQASDHLAELFKQKGDAAEAEAPHLSQLFHVGQLVRCIVTEVGRGAERIGLEAMQQSQVCINILKP